MSPLPPYKGLDAARIRTPDRNHDVVVEWQTMVQWLRHKLPEHIDIETMVEEGGFVYEDGRCLCAQDPYRPGTFIWFHREVPPEVPVVADIPVIYEDDRLLVVDKPPFLATTPRGIHVRQTALVRLKHERDLPELAPMHRLDRLTAGLLVFTKRRQWRGVYQPLFQRGAVAKVYQALAPIDPALGFPLTVSNHIEKVEGSLRARVIGDRPANAHTEVELLDQVQGVGRYLLRPLTGKTHQLRVHMSGLGLPILNDPFYPEVVSVPLDDFTRPLQLLAKELSFIDPVGGRTHHWHSARDLPLV